MPSAPLLGLDTAGAISLLVGTVLPLLVGLLTRQQLNPGLKAALLAALSGLSGVLSQWLSAMADGRHFAWQQAVLSAFLTWAAGELAYLKVWKPSGLAAGVQSRGVSDPGGYEPLAADYADDETYAGPDVVLPAHAEAGLAVQSPAPVATGTAAAVRLALEPPAQD